MLQQDVQLLSVKDWTLVCTASCEECKSGFDFSFARQLHSQLYDKLLFYNQT